jgi:hypothetical protein
MHASLAARDFFYALQQNFCHMPTTATARSRCQDLLNIIDLSYLLENENCAFSFNLV